MRVFARAGCQTTAWDRDGAAAERAVRITHDEVDSDLAADVISAAEAARTKANIRTCDTLEAALEGVGFVQESGPEDMTIKRAMYAELDAAAAPEVILGSSTSAMDMTEIAQGLPGASRCIVTHPVNPPHVVPATEVLGGEATSEEVLTRTVEFLRSVGQTPVLMNKYVHGFILNRLQAALMREAIQLVERDVASVDAVDAAMRDGLGLRWALLGSFGVNNTNADGGIREYYTRYGPAYKGLMDALDPAIPVLDEALIDKIAAQTNEMEGDAPVGDLCLWRNRLIQKILRIRREDPHPGRPS